MSNTLFSKANAAWRKKYYEAALLTYEFLHDVNPSFKQYKINQDIVGKILTRASINPRIIRKMHHLKSASIPQRCLRISHEFSRFGDTEGVQLCSDQATELKNQFHLAMANAHLTDANTNLWLAHFNHYLRPFGVQASCPDQIDTDIFDKLQITPIKNSNNTDGPLVTVCISCFNAENYVHQAVTSLLRQTYRNLEIILIDDRSTDQTAQILQELARSDLRVKLLFNKKNQGTYRSRNHAFKIAKGKYFTILDADDYAFPTRIIKEVEHLESNELKIGVLTDWLRVAANGNIHFKRGWGGAYQHEAVATLMIRTDPVRNAIGYWDAVRFAADTEFYFRLKTFFGGQSLSRINEPTSLARFHPNSLTNDPITGIDVGDITGLSPVRVTYREAWKRWHKEILNKKELFLSPSPHDRPFPAPDEMTYKV